MKVAILTITDGQNYGNRLQNYALQEILKKYGIKVETIKILTIRDKKVPLIVKSKIFIKNIIKFIIGRTIYTEKERRKRKMKFDEFNKKYISFSGYKLGLNHKIGDLPERYDYFVCGSDQVWNTKIEIVRENINYHLAEFAKDEQRISYAASFGTNDILPEYEELFRNELLKFKAISVRECSGVELVKKISGRRGTRVTLDPTMLLDSEDWRRLSHKPDFIINDYEKFIFTYFLGGRNEKITTHINFLERKYMCRTYHAEIEFLNDKEIEDKRCYEMDPCEFIWMIEHAECVLTDSFHATVFSILFFKPFCVFQRIPVEDGNNMESRIDTLLNTFQLMQFKDDIDNPKKFPELYSKNNIENILKVCRENSMKFLEEAMEMTNSAD